LLLGLFYLLEKKNILLLLLSFIFKEELTLLIKKIN